MSFGAIGVEIMAKIKIMRVVMVNSNPRIPFVTQDSLFVNENPVL